MKVYELRLDKRHTKHLQDASLNTDDYGIYPTHGLFGSDEWWSSIKSGELEVHTFCGTLSDVFMSGHNDYPEFKVLDKQNNITSWTREANTPELDTEYQIGKFVEIDYVLQRQRLRGRPGKETKCVIEIRIHDNC